EVDLTKRGLIFSADSGTPGRLPPVAIGLDVVRIWDLNGRPVFDYTAPPGLPAAEPPTRDALTTDGPRYDRVQAADGAGVRLYAELIQEKGKPLGIVQVGRSEADLEAMLGQLRLLGLLGLAVAVVLAWSGGSFLAARALAPVDRITRAANRIGAEGLSERLSIQLPNDELGRLATAFNAMIERLEQAFQRQQRFTADASHELRTPLAIIRSQAELARDRPREPAYDTAAFASLYEESERLGRLVESLLVLARADAGAALRLAPIDLEALVAEVSQQAILRAQGRGLQLITRIAETPPVRGDETWLVQLLLNLLDNALRHTPAGGVVTVSLAPAPGGLRLEVADTGGGIPAEHLPRLFERFYRVDTARGHATGGSGLGLAICAWVARAHGGRLEIASEVGRGTTVSLWLPAVEPPQSSSGSHSIESTVPLPASTFTSSLGSGPVTPAP
ncbi:MAG: HAMP domain-containing histidine kinase, partial [Chloroflexi bacterium]|nr:HAMP domain-containing histidine kinase [Chloroflexota bacterium]